MFDRDWQDRIWLTQVPGGVYFSGDQRMGVRMGRAFSFTILMLATACNCRADTLEVRVLNLRVTLGVILTTVSMAVLFIVFVVNKAVKAHRRRPVSGAEGLVGETGWADSDLAPEGKVFVRGEYWDAWCDERIAKGEKVAVAAVKGMRLKVRRSETGND
jgi:membrane-bound ClpP family serine protease